MDSLNEPHVSVIIPCYNAERYIGEAIESIQRQTYANWELIVIDDGSTDDSATIIRGYSERDDRIHLIQQENSGESRARNVGIYHAVPSSRYLYFLDADDVAKPSLLERQISYLEAHPDVGLVYANIEHIGSEGETLGQKWSGVMSRHEPTKWGVRSIPSRDPETPFAALFAAPKPMIQTCVARREVVESINGFEEKESRGEDTDFFWRAALRAKVHFLDEVLALYRRHANQQTAGSAIVKQSSWHLYEWWRTRTDLSPDERAQVRAAWYFRYGRIGARRRKRAAIQCWKKGEYGTACMQMTAGIIRYLYSFIPPGLKLPLIGNVEQC